MTAEERQILARAVLELDWLRTEVARLREKVEGRTDAPASAGLRPGWLKRQLDQVAEKPARKPDHLEVAERYEASLASTEET